MLQVPPTLNASKQVVDRLETLADRVAMLDLLQQKTRWLINCLWQ